MNLQQRISFLVALGQYMMENDADWLSAKQLASYKNPWFTIENIDLASKAIAENFLQKEKLESWIKQYSIQENNLQAQTIGVVMAGNIPLVGFHDFLCVFVTGNKQKIKLSSKDDVLLPFLIKKMQEKYPPIDDYVSFAENLKGCDAYIATGSNNAGRYFDYYFGKYPSIIRRNRTSVAILEGVESDEQLSLLAKDIYTYFGLGCRNVTMLYVPEQYDFVPFINILKQYEHLLDFSKYKNNYDYQLAILLLNKKFYMSGGGLLLEENPIIFSPISTIHYQYYADKNELIARLQNSEDIQTIVAKNHTPFGSTQQPTLTDYADGIDTMSFLSNLNKR